LSFVAIELIVMPFYNDIQKLKITVFWDVTPAIKVGRNQCFGRFCCLQGIVRMEGQVPTKHGYIYTRLRNDTSEKTVTFIFTTMGPSNLTQLKMFVCPCK
jgi:hypothetical protein